MSVPERDEDLFLPSGRVRLEAFDEPAGRALQDSLGHARSTNWDSVRTPHLFMGVLGTSDLGVDAWAQRLGADKIRLLDQFRELFFQDLEPVPPLHLTREFLSDNALRILRDAALRSKDYGRSQISPMDLMITIFTTPNNIVVECFERIGVTGALLTELAVSVEQESTMS